MCECTNCGFWGQQFIYQSNLSFSSFVFVLGSVQGCKLKIVLWWRSRLWIAPVWSIRPPTESKSLLGLNIFLYFALLTLVRRYFPRFVPDASLNAPNSSLIACFPALLFWVYVFLRLTLRKHFPRFRLAARNPRKIFVNVLCRIDNYDSYFLQVFLPSEE